MSRQFTVIAERGCTGWRVTERAKVDTVSQVRRLDQVCNDIREAVTYLAGLPEDDAAIDIALVLPQTYREHVTHAKERREKKI